MGHVLGSAALGLLQPSSPPGPSSLIKLSLVVSQHVALCPPASNLPWQVFFFSPDHHTLPFHTFLIWSHCSQLLVSGQGASFRSRGSFILA